MLREISGAEVIALDLRGHGQSGGTPGDVDYIGQYETDVADVVAAIRAEKPNGRFILAGHSMGGGIALRFAQLEDHPAVDAYLMFAPHLGSDAPTMPQPDPDNPAAAASAAAYSQLNVPRLIGLIMLNNVGITGLTMLNNLGIHWFDGLTVIQFAMPQHVLDGPLGDSATTAYSHRLNTSFAPRGKYGRDLAALTQPFLLVAGLDDEAFIAGQYEPTISQYTDSCSYVLLPNTGHISLLTSPELASIVTDWLGHLDAAERG
jgi:pimeloyl-ACP methyl ester carboxylesterase